MEKTLISPGSLNVNELSSCQLAGEAWQQLAFKQAAETLQNLSRARQITGHSPFFNVKHGTTGLVVGRVSQTSIAVLLPGEGFIEYVPDSDTPTNTVY